MTKEQLREEIRGSSPSERELLVEILIELRLLNEALNKRK